MKMTDIEIALSQDLEPITDIAEKVGLKPDEIILYGDHIAKVKPSVREGRESSARTVLVTAMTADQVGDSVHVMVTVARVDHEGAKPGLPVEKALVSVRVWVQGEEVGTLAGFSDADGVARFSSGIEPETRPVELWIGAVHHAGLHHCGLIDVIGTVRLDD